MQGIGLIRLRIGMSYECGNEPPDAISNLVNNNNNNNNNTFIMTKFSKH